MAAKTTAKAPAKTQAPTKPEPEPEAAKPKAEPKATPAFTDSDGKAVQGQTGVFKLVEGELGARGPEGGQRFEFVALYPVTGAMEARAAAIKAGDVSGEDKLLTLNVRFASRIA
jgi:hypothetical protein